MVSLNLGICSTVTMEMILSIKEEIDGIEDARLKKAMRFYLKSLQKRYDDQIRIDNKKW